MIREGSPSSLNPDSRPLVETKKSTDKEARLRELALEINPLNEQPPELVEQLALERYATEQWEQNCRLAHVHAQERLQEVGVNTDIIDQLDMWEDDHLRWSPDQDHYRFKADDEGNGLHYSTWSLEASNGDAENPHDDLRLKVVHRDDNEVGLWVNIEQRERAEESAYRLNTGFDEEGNLESLSVEAIQSVHHRQYPNLSSAMSVWRIEFRGDGTLKYIRRIRPEDRDYNRKDHASPESHYYPFPTEREKAAQCLEEIKQEEGFGWLPSLEPPEGMVIDGPATLEATLQAWAEDNSAETPPVIKYKPTSDSTT